MTFREQLGEPAAKLTLARKPRDLPADSDVGRHPLLQLQRSLGNRRVNDLIRAERVNREGRLLSVISDGMSSVVQRDPRHDRGHGGEQTMGFGYSQAKGWIFVEGPSGAGGHGVTAPGFDGVAYHIEADELHLPDNKSLKADTAGSASAIAKNLATNLEKLETKLRGMKDMPSRIRILQLVQQTRASIASGTSIPKNVKLIVTGEGGRAKEISGTLEKLGVEFRNPGVTDAELAAGPPTPAAVPKPPDSAGASEGGSGPTSPHGGEKPAVAEHVPAKPAVAPPEAVTPIETPNVEAGSAPHVAVPEGEGAVPKAGGGEPEISGGRGGVGAVSGAVGILVLVGQLIPDYAEREAIDRGWSNSLGSPKWQARIKEFQPEIAKALDDRYYTFLYQIHFDNTTSPKPQTFGPSRSVKSVEIVDLILTRDDRTYMGDVKPKKKPDDAKPIMGGGYYWESHMQSVVSQKVETGGQARARQAIEKRMLEKLRNAF